MGKVLVGAAISLDGLASDPQGNLDALYPDLDALRETEVLQESIRTTGAAILGRRAYDMAEDPDLYAEHYEYQVPLFILTHRPPAHKPREAGGLTFTYVTDGIESAVRQARAAAGERDVTVVGGISTFRQCVNAVLADELHLDIVPVLLGAGPRLWDGVDPAALRLERIAVIEMANGRTHLRYRIVR